MKWSLSLALSGTHRILQSVRKLGGQFVNRDPALEPFALQLHAPECSHLSKNGRSTHSITLALITLVVLQMGTALSVAVFGADDPQTGDDSAAAITIQELKNHVAVLASDAMEGREAGSRGGRAASAYILQQLRTIPSIQPGGINGDWFQEFGAGFRNILAVIPGSDAAERDCILIGAHYDHVGYGKPGNSFGPIGQIHNGADDNGSGVAAVLELAESLAVKRLSYSIVVAFWDGEEQGLLGSKHWVAQPTLDFDRIKFVVNIDMIGRLHDPGMDVLGTRTAAGLRQIVSRQNSEKIKLLFDWDVAGDTDHYPFYQRSVPFLSFFTGKHEDYHRPSDDVHKLNYRGFLAATQLLERSILQIAAKPLPKFRTAGKLESDNSRNAAQQRAARAGVPRLDMQYQLHSSRAYATIVGITVNGLAWTHGLHAGDQILTCNGQGFATRDLTDLIRETRGSLELHVRSRGQSPTRVVKIPVHAGPEKCGLVCFENSGEPGVAIVARVVPNSRAARKGFAASDRVSRINGQKFASMDEFRELLNAAEQLSQPISMSVERLGIIRQVTIPPAK